MVEIKIDGKSVTARKNATILEAAEEAGIYIPTFCHYKMLAPFGACRACIVEVKGSPKLFTACTTPIADKMEIITKSPKLAQLRKTLIELLLIHHPLDCPVCDKGGECQLQDLTYEFGVAKVRFDEKPKNTPVDHSNPFIERDIDRCVLCGKCVRICDEVVNIQSISFIRRGTNTYIGTAFDQPWHCEYCGQCLSVCPVGSLNNRVYLFKNRPWNLTSTYSICGFCSCGCTIRIDHEADEVYRIKEDVDKGINHGFLCVKGRFGYELINSTERKDVAVINEGSEKKEVAVHDAINLAFNKLKDIVKNNNSKALGFYISPRLTNEEAYLAQKIAREYFKTNNIYSSEVAYAKPEGTFKDVEDSDAIIVFNVDVTESNPILGLAVRRSARAGAKLVVLYPSFTALKRVATEFVTGKPSDLYSACENLLVNLNTKNKSEDNLSEILKNAQNPVLIYNPYNNNDLYYVKKIKDLLPLVKLLPAKLKNNSQGIADMGCVNGYGPGYRVVERGLDFEKAILNNELKYLVVFGENLLESTIGTEFNNIRKKLNLLLVIDPFLSETAKLADIYIPVSLYAEKNGSYTNMEGRVQTIQKAVNKSKLSDLEVLIKFYEMAGLTQFKDIKDIRIAIENDTPLYKGINWEGGLIKYSEVIIGDFTKYKLDKDEKSSNFILYPEASRLHSGTFTRWSDDLNKVYSEPVVNLNPIDAKSLKIGEGDRVIIKCGAVKGIFKTVINEHLTKGLATLPDNYSTTIGFFKNGPYCNVNIIKE
jgi:formate dehydrogenase major subunit/NADH-quinone oxidoreductase subunit G